MDNEDTIYLKMAETGAPELLKVLKDVEAGTAVAVPQDNDKATYAPPLSKEEGLIDFKKSAKRFSKIVRCWSVSPFLIKLGKLAKVLLRTV